MRIHPIPSHREPFRRPAAMLRHSGQSGLSLLEVTIAGALVLVIAIGVLPMMVRSLTNNQLGWQATEMSNHFRSVFDELKEVPFNGNVTGLETTVPENQTELVTDMFYTAGQLAQVQDDDEGWWTADDLGVAGDTLYRGEGTNRGPVLWVRRSRVRQFNVDALGNLDDPTNIPFRQADALPGGPPENGGALADSVHLKEIFIELTEAKAAGGAEFVGASRFSIVMYKAF